MLSFALPKFLSVGAKIIQPDTDSHRRTQKEGLLGEESPPSDWSMGISVGHFLGCCLMWEGPGYRGWYHPCGSGPGLCRKTAEAKAKVAAHVFNPSS